MKFKTKLYLGFGFILNLFIVLLIFLIMMMNQLNQSMSDTVKSYEYSKLANTIQSSINIYSREAKGLLADPPKELIETFEERKDKALDDAETAIKTLQRLDKREASQQLVNELISLTEELRKIEAEIEELKNEGKSQEAMDLFWFDSWKIIEAVIAASNELQSIQEKSVGTELKGSSETYELALKLISAYAIIGFLVFIFLTIRIVRSITNNLNNEL